MPNFCAINIDVDTNYVRFNRQRAVLNEEETDYIYKSTEEILKKDNLRIVFVNNTEDEKIKKLVISKADTREEYMNWNMNSSDQTVGFETISIPSDSMLGNKVSGESDFPTALTNLLSQYNITL